MARFLAGVLIAWAVEAIFLLMLVDFSALQYPENDAIAIVAVGLFMGAFVGGVAWGLGVALDEADR